MLIHMPNTRGFSPEFFYLVIGGKPPKINLAVIGDFWRNNILFNKKKTSPISGDFFFKNLKLI
jgi:hypothetical protein